MGITQVVSNFCYEFSTEHFRCLFERIYAKCEGQTWNVNSRNELKSNMKGVLFDSVFKTPGSEMHPKISIGIQYQAKDFLSSHLQPCPKLIV